VATFFIALFILILQFLWQHIDDLAGKGLDGNVIAEMLAYASAGLVPTALPLAILLSSIMTFGNLGENFELTAVKSSGISLQKFMKPLIVMSIAFSIGIFFYSNYIIPYTNLKAMSLIYDIKKQREELQIREGVFYNDIEGYSLKVSKKNPRTKLMKDIMIYDHSSSKGNVQVTTADSGYIKMTSDETKLLVTLYNGQTYQEMEDKKKGRKSEKEYPHRITKFDEQTMLIDLKGFDFTRTDESLFSDHYQMMNISQLKENEDSLNRNFKHLASKFSKDISHNYFIHKKLLKRYQESEQRRREARDNMKKKTKIKQNDSAASINMKGEKENKIKNDSAKKADSLKIKKDSLALIDSGKNEINDTINQTVTKQDTITKTFNLQTAFDTIEMQQKVEILQRAQDYARRNSKKISNSKRRFEIKQKILYKHQIEWHKKFTLSFACIIFFFIGAPLGSIIRKGGLGTPLVISVILFIVYYIISMTGENFAEKGVIPAFVGMWLSSFIFLPIGIFLTYKATNDSVILNPDTYIKGIKKIISFRFKNGKQSKSE
jgi:lipopolysaccharide export system permease protein